MKHKIKKEINEEIIYKTYEDNALIQFEVTLAKEKEWFTLITGLPSNGEIKNIETLERIIECLKAAHKKWKKL